MHELQYRSLLAAMYRYCSSYGDNLCHFKTSGKCCLKLTIKNKYSYNLKPANSCSLCFQNLRLNRSSGPFQTKPATSAQPGASAQKIKRKQFVDAFHQNNASTKKRPPRT